MNRINKQMVDSTLSEKEVEKIAEETAKALGSKFSVTKGSVDNRSFSLDYDGVKYDGGSYLIMYNGDIVNVAIMKAPIYYNYKTKKKYEFGGDFQSGVYEWGGRFQTQDTAEELIKDGYGIYEGFESYKDAEDSCNIEDLRSGKVIIVRINNSYCLAEKRKMLDGGDFQAGVYAGGGGVGLIGNQKRIDMNKNGKIDAEDFKILRSSMNGAWRKEHKYANHSEDYEVRYAKPRPKRTGYKGKRKFDDGGSIEDKLVKLNLEKSKLKDELMEATMSGNMSKKASIEKKLNPINIKINNLLKKKYAWKMYNGGLNEKTFAVYEVYFGQPNNFYNEDKDEFVWSDPKKATLYTKEDAENVRLKLLKPRIDYYQRTGKNYKELHVGDLYKQNILKFAEGGGVGLIGNQKRIDMNKNGKIDAEDFKILRSSMNGAWRKEHKYANHSEDYEVRYAKPRPKRTGYKGKRNFKDGGGLSFGGKNPKIEKYSVYIEYGNDNDNEMKVVELDFTSFKEAYKVYKQYSKLDKYKGEDIIDMMILKYYLNGDFEQVDDVYLNGGGIDSDKSKSENSFTNKDGIRVRSKVEPKEKMSEKDWMAKHNSSKEARTYDDGGKTDTPAKKGKGNHKMKATTDLAKKIRKEGEKWTDALRRASQQMKIN
jgi:hypothetical protein